MVESVTSDRSALKAGGYQAPVGGKQVRDKAPSAPAVEARIQTTRAPVTNAPTDRTIIPIHDKTVPNEQERLNTTRATLTQAKRVTIERDSSTGEVVVKFTDHKGNVIIQVPPVQYLKLLQLMGGAGQLHIQDVSQEAKFLMSSGSLLNKKV